MTKFLILYNSLTSASEQMASATPEEMQASMAEWIAWKDEVSQKVGFEFGMPLQAVAKLTNSGVGESSSFISGYSIMEGDSKELVEDLLKSHPHLKRDGASIELLEMLPMPGM